MDSKTMKFDLQYQVSLHAANITMIIHYNIQLCEGIFLGSIRLN